MSGPLLHFSNANISENNPSLDKETRVAQHLAPQFLSVTQTIDVHNFKDIAPEIAVAALLMTSAGRWKRGSGRTHRYSKLRSAWYIFRVALDSDQPCQCTQEGLLNRERRKLAHEAAKARA